MFFTDCEFSKYYPTLKGIAHLLKFRAINYVKFMLLNIKKENRFLTRTIPLP